MKITNLYNFESILPFTLVVIKKLPSGPRKLTQPEEEGKDSFWMNPGLYDAAKQNKLYRKLLEDLKLDILALKELRMIRCNVPEVSMSSTKTLLNSRKDKWKNIRVKFRYLLTKFNLYWPPQVGKVEILLKRFFFGWILGKIALEFWVSQNILKAFISDYRRMLRLFRGNLKCGSKSRILEPEHLLFIDNFLSEN